MKSKGVPETTDHSLLPAGLRLGGAGEQKSARQCQMHNGLLHTFYPVEERMLTKQSEWKEWLGHACFLERLCSDLRWQGR